MFSYSISSWAFYPVKHQDSVNGTTSPAALMLKDFKEKLLSCCYLNSKQKKVQIDFTESDRFCCLFLSSHALTQYQYAASVWARRNPIETRDQRSCCHVRIVGAVVSNRVWTFSLTRAHIRAVHLLNVCANWPKASYRLAWNVFGCYWSVSQTS